LTEEKKPVRVIIDPASQVNGPSVGLLVTGIVGAVFSVFVLFSLGIGLSLGPLWEWGHFDSRYEDFIQGAFGMGSAFIGLLVAAFIIYAALQMKELKQWNLAVVASVLAMIPCISPCCIIGLPIGIWSLVVLTRPDVKQAFQ
jgi:hypothetical protein